MRLASLGWRPSGASQTPRSFPDSLPPGCDIELQELSPPPALQAMLDRSLQPAPPPPQPGLPSRVTDALTSTPARKGGLLLVKAEQAALTVAQGSQVAPPESAWTGALEGTAQALSVTLAGTGLVQGARQVHEALTLRQASTALQEQHPIAAQRAERIARDKLLVGGTTLLSSAGAMTANILELTPATASLAGYALGLGTGGVAQAGIGGLATYQACRDGLFLQRLGHAQEQLLELRRVFPRHEVVQSFVVFESQRLQQLATDKSIALGGNVALATGSLAALGATGLGLAGHVAAVGTLSVAAAATGIGAAAIIAGSAVVMLGGWLYKRRQTHQEKARIAARWADLTAGPHTQGEARSNPAVAALCTGDPEQVKAQLVTAVQLGDDAVSHRIVEDYLGIVPAEMFCRDPDLYWSQHLA